MKQYLKKSPRPTSPLLHKCVKAYATRDPHLALLLNMRWRHSKQVMHVLGHHKNVLDNAVHQDDLGFLLIYPEQFSLLCLI